MSTPEAGPPSAPPTRPAQIKAKARSWWVHHPLTAIGALVGLGVVFGVQMIRAAFLDLPSPALVWHLLGQPDAYLAVGLWVFVILLAWAAALSWGFTRPEADELGLWGRVPRLVRAPSRLARTILDRTLLAPMARLSVRARRIQGGVAILAAVGLWCALRWSSAVVPEAGPPLMVGWAYLLALLGGWLLAARFDQDGAPGPGTAACARGLALIAFSSAFGTVLWVVVTLPNNPLTMRLFTLWAAVHIGVVALAAGRAGDAVGRSLPQRYAIGAGLAALFVWSVVLPVPIGHDARGTCNSHTASRDEARSDVRFWKEVFNTHAACEDGAALVRSGVDEDLAWFTEVQRRVDATPEGEPVIFLAAAGGGSRAALYATLVLEALERTPPHGDIGDWGALEEEDEEGEMSSLADRLLFISSVSGGSVASARFSLETQDEPLRTARNTVPGELRKHFSDELDVQCALQLAECEQETRQGGGGQGHSEGPHCTHYGRLCDSPGGNYPGADEGFDRLNFDSNPEGAALQWPIDSARFDDLAMDFIAPLIRGMVTPGVERGESMSNFWRSTFGWQHMFKEDPESARAVMLVNIASVEQGTRVVASFPRLPQGLLREDDSSADHTGSAWIEAASGARGLADIERYLSVDVEEAVRMSSNFPYGFDLPHLGLGSEFNQRALMVDGGVLDNTGIDTLAILLDRLALLANPLLADEVPQHMHEGASALLEQLALRGVVLIEVDAGGKPSEPSALQRNMANVLMPLHSLSISSFVRAGDATRQYVHSMDEVLTQRAERSLALQLSETAHEDLPQGLTGSRLRHVRYVLDTEGLMTAWALTPTQKGQLLARFLAEDVTQREVLRDAFEDLEGRNRARCELAADAVKAPNFVNLLEDLAKEEQDLSSINARADEAAAEARRSQYNGEVLVISSDERSAQDAAQAQDGWVAVGYYARPDTHDVVDPQEGGEAPSVGLGLECEQDAPHMGPGHWLMTHLRLDRTQDPDLLNGRVVDLSDTMVLRQAKPGPDGYFQVQTGILAAGTRVKLSQVQPWEGTGYYFARATELVEVR